MSAPQNASRVTVALIGNPNTGKSTLFSALCGVRQRIGNFPGVTVEKKVGQTSFNGQSFSVVDLPGSYSLAPRSPDEMVAVDVLLGRQDDHDPPDVILCIVDASNLERNLYLVSQVLELGRPTVLALNMVDVAEKKAVHVDAVGLAKRLGITVVEVQANKRRGLTELKEALAAAVDAEPKTLATPFPAAFQEEVAQLLQTGTFPRYLAERLLLDTSGYLASAEIPGVGPATHAAVIEARQRLNDANISIPAIEAICRYQWIGEVTKGICERLPKRELGLTDRVLTHRWWGILFFAFVMILMFQSVFYVAEPASALIDRMNDFASDLVVRTMAPGALRSLLISGVIEGVGGVLVFLPQIFVLFLFIAILEDCGYMARAAYLMDRLMSRVGLSGKSFIPLLSSFACAIPGIMAARVIENPKDRLVTILIAPLMSCSARLPVYTLLIGAFIPDQRYLGNLIGLKGVTMFAMYMIGIVTATLVALVLRRTLLKGSAPPFVMELPSYKLPGLDIVVYRVLDRGWSFVRRAGTLIFAITIVVWAAGYYPHNPADVDAELFEAQTRLETSIGLLDGEVSGDAVPRHEQMEVELARVEGRIAGQYLRYSVLGRLGQFVEPVVKPLGWDWRIGCAAIASLPAREVVIATFGVIYNLGEEESESRDSLKETLRKATWEESGELVFNTPVALSVMVFFALCAQCASTLVVMRRETNSWRWPAFAFVYMTVLAYLGALVTYQIGMLFVAA
jgi:ferrous iron transport protein B